MNNFILFGFLMSLTFIQSAVGRNCFDEPAPVNDALLSNLLNALCGLIGGTPGQGLPLDCPAILQQIPPVTGGLLPGLVPLLTAVLNGVVSLVCHLVKFLLGGGTGIGG
ncbi:UNVERIFIED_CONTAM: hypothetical protein RMT77_019186 [Armadillidium vulgare]